MVDQSLIDACLCKLDDLEAIIFSIRDDLHLRYLRNRLTTIVDDYTSILNDELSK